MWRCPVASSPTVLERSYDLQPVVARPAAKPAVPARVVWKRRLAKTSRWLHIYGSMISLAVVLFFSATGITLNHPQWFAGQERTTEYAGAMNTAWLTGAGAETGRLNVVEYLRATHRISGAVSDFRVDDGETAVSFKGPGYAADAFIDRATGKYTVTETRLGIGAVMNDLHKGRDTGGIWKAVIDIAAGLLCFVSLSGLLLLYFLQKHRTAGIILMGFGALATYAIYVTAVP